MNCTETLAKRSAISYFILTRVNLYQTTATTALHDFAIVQMVPKEIAERLFYFFEDGKKIMKHSGMKSL